jgi:hypothetical protein
MWTTESSIETTVPADAIWRAWVDDSGPGADAMGPAISADFDDTLTALVEHAGR